LIVAALVLLVAAGGAAWHYLGLGAPGTQAVLSPPPQPPLATPTPLPPAPSPDAAATLEPSAAQGDAPSALDPSGSVPPVAAPTPRPAVTAPVAPAEPTLADARTLLRQGRLGEAANGFVTNLRETPAGSFSIQLLVACSSDTVEKALASVAAPDLYILPVNYKGRPCYRVCWGLYDNEMRADSAVRTLPEYFRKGGASPRVVPTSGLLP
jgi:septal ring-binding cell division protein DamX